MEVPILNVSLLWCGRDCTRMSPVTSVIGGLLDGLVALYI